MRIQSGRSPTFSPSDGSGSQAHSFRKLVQFPCFPMDQSVGSSCRDSQWEIGVAYRADYKVAISTLRICGP